MTRNDIIAAFITLTIFGALFGWATARWADVELAPTTEARQ